MNFIKSFSAVISKKFCQNWWRNRFFEKKIKICNCITRISIQTRIKEDALYIIQVYFFIKRYNKYINNIVNRNYDLNVEVYICP